MKFDIYLHYGIILITKGEIKVMKMVKDINKLIIKKVVEIVFVLGFIVYSAHLWQSQNMQMVLTSLANYNKTNYTSIHVYNPIDYNMYPMEDAFAVQHLAPCTVEIVNETYTNENYELVLKIDKSSTLDYHYLHLGIDDEIYDLKTLLQKETDQEYIFLLNEGTIKGEIKEYKMRLWLEEDAGNELQGKNLKYHFALSNETTNV